MPSRRINMATPALLPSKLKEISVVPLTNMHRECPNKETKYCRKACQTSAIISCLTLFAFQILKYIYTHTDTVGVIQPILIAGGNCE